MIVDFNKLSKQIKQEWYEGYEAYKKRMHEAKKNPRGFHLWIRDFGFLME